MTPSQAAQEKPTSPRTYYPIRLTPTEIRDAVAALGKTGTRAEARVKAAALGMADAIEEREAAAAKPSLDEQMGLVRPACQSEHRPEHWKRGQSPRATRLVVFRDGHREYLCKRCVTQARRTSSTDPREQVERTELPA